MRMVIGYIDIFIIKKLCQKRRKKVKVKEIVEILANLDTDWEEKITKHQLIPFFERYLSDEKTYDERSGKVTRSVTWTYGGDFV